MMIYRFGLENGNDDRSIAWSLEHPGCYAYGNDGELAMAAAPEGVREYINWVIRNGGDWLNPSNSIEPKLDETFQVYRINEDYELEQDAYQIESFFLYDWKPLTEEEVKRAFKLLDWSRQDLLQAVAGLTPETLEHKFPGERWNINGILKHTGGAEWWYLDRLQLAFPQEQVSPDPFERLEQVRASMNKALPGLVGEKRVVGLDGEIWSARKLLRRAVWHERDHIQHIQKLVTLYQAENR